MQKKRLAAQAKYYTPKFPLEGIFKTQLKARRHAPRKANRTTVEAAHKNNSSFPWTERFKN